MFKLIVVITVPFIIIALWRFLAARKIRYSHYLMIIAMTNDMEKMAKKLGHDDLKSYYTKVEGEKYAEAAMMNLNKFRKSFTPEGPG